MIKKILKSGYVVLKKITSISKLNKILKNISNSKNIVLIGSPLHGNIGDHAISIAEIKLLKKTNNNIIEIPGEYFNLFTRKIIDKINDKDIIVITGGGFIGTLWKNEEEMIRNIILSFPNNKIVIMPQTVYFEKSKEGLEELKKSKRIYEGHKDLNMFVREEKSYKFCKENFSNVKSLELVPDIVTYLNYEDKSVKRDGVLFCLRQDKEKVLDNKIIDEIIDLVNKKQISVKYTTTVIKEKISLDKRDIVFENKLKEFKSSNLVVTDRLHGMLFAAITSTPCIAFDNLSGKVKGVYNWIKKLNYVKIIDKNNINTCLDEVNRLLHLKECKYDNSDLSLYFDKIIEKIEN